MSTLTTMEIHNIFSKDEVNNMLSESIQNVFTQQDQKLAEQRREQEQRIAEQRREHDQRITEQRREFEARMQEVAKRDETALQELKNELKEGRDRSDRIWQSMMNELAANRRWTIATIITVGLSIVTYLSALVHFSR